MQASWLLRLLLETSAAAEALQAQYCAYCAYWRPSRQSKMGLLPHVALKAFNPNFMSNSSGGKPQIIWHASLFGGWTRSVYLTHLGYKGCENNQSQ